MRQKLFTRSRAVLIGAAVLLGAQMAAAQTPPPSNASGAAAQAEPAYFYQLVFPAEIPGLGFAMPKQVFLDVLAAKKLTHTANAANNMFLVSPPGAPYSGAVYFFNSKAGEILTEMELRFADDVKAKAYFDARFLPEDRNSDNEWVYRDSALPYAVKIWRFQSKVYIVVTMANTRWAAQ
jgi:hypothetical protein